MDTTITREIGIDMGHRVTNHGSKCRNIHGHRYRIEAYVEGSLFTEGEQEGMVLDFGFLKEEMMNLIDIPCDHAMCIWEKDFLLMDMLVPQTRRDEKGVYYDYHKAVIRTVRTSGAASVLGYGDMKMYIVDFVPTAENLAAHWAKLLAPRVEARTDGRAKLIGLRVWETPNSSAYVNP